MSSMFGISLEMAASTERGGAAPRVRMFGSNFCTGIAKINRVIPCDNEYSPFVFSPLHRVLPCDIIHRPFRALPIVDFYFTRKNTY